MSAGWQVGDLALCIRRFTGDYSGPRPTVNGVYRVTGVDFSCDAYDEIGLRLEGLDTYPEETEEANWADCYASSFFRKITPPPHEACDVGFASLLDKLKRPVPVEVA